jgi:hypothetical protein
MSKDENKTNKADKDLEILKGLKPIDERISETYTRIERKKLGKPQTSIKFKIFQIWKLNL